MHDILIKNAQVIDGSGASQFPADVAIKNDRIAAVGKLESSDSETTIDADGLAVTPGFIDMHSHADYTLPVWPTADSLVHQGITTIVCGQCGFSPAPLRKETREAVIKQSNALLGSKGPHMPWDQWSAFGDYLHYLERIGISLNVVPLVGQGVVRAAVMGYSVEAANNNQVSMMQAEVEKALDEGAFGLSTGLIYPPGSYASSREIAAVAGPVGKRDRLYFSHIRGEADTLLQALSEAIDIGRQTGSAVQISHFKASYRDNWDKSALALELIDNARAEGLDVTADMYPYLAGSTMLAAMLPEWAQEGGKDAILKRLANSGNRQQMTESMQSAGFFKNVEWDKVFISDSPNNPEYQGHDIASMAAQAGKSPYEWVFDVLRETDLNMMMILFSMSEENRKRELRHPAMMIGTDGMGYAAAGPMSSGLPHPRSYGTFPRILGHYVRKQNVITLAEAIFKMSGLPAQKLGLENRGRIKEGNFADLVIFDPRTVIDTATFEAPHQYPHGIFHVMVNGRLVVKDGVHTGERSGCVIRK